MIIRVNKIKEEKNCLIEVLNEMPKVAKKISVSEHFDKVALENGWQDISIEIMDKIKLLD